MKSKKTLISSSIIILLCLAIILGVTYALFTDSITTSSHLRAGTLDAVLTRTNLKYSVLGENGRLVENEITADVDFTEDSSDNVFGISDNMRIAPKSYFDADFSLGHADESNVAFDYAVGIELNGTSNALAAQLEVTVTRPDGTTVAKKLSEFTGGYTVVVGTIEANAANQNFSVRIDFVNDVTVNANLASGATPIDNDLAQIQELDFDLYVEATQVS